MKIKRLDRQVGDDTVVAVTSFELKAQRRLPVVQFRPLAVYFAGVISLSIRISISVDDLPST